jgi:DNA-binding MarR family transcriptional regulator
MAHIAAHARSTAVAEIGSACLAVRARMLSRAVSAIYDRTMEGHDVTISQVNIMVMVGHRPACTPGEIGRTLAMERSTVSRNLRPLLERGWLAGDVGDAGRLRSVRLTQRGEKKVASLIPSWRRAQDLAASLLGQSGAASLKEIGDRLWMRAGPAAA